MIHRFLHNIWWATDPTLSNKYQVVFSCYPALTEKSPWDTKQPAVLGCLSVTPYPPDCHPISSWPAFAIAWQLPLSSPFWHALRVKSVTLPTMWDFNSWQAQSKTSSVLALWAVWFSDTSLSTWNCKSRETDRPPQGFWNKRDTGPGKKRKVQYAVPCFGILSAGEQPLEGRNLSTSFTEIWKGFQVLVVLVLAFSPSCFISLCAQPCSGNHLHWQLGDVIIFSSHLQFSVLLWEIPQG